MAFDGAFGAPAIVPSGFGLFSIFPPTNPTSGEKWVRGFDQWWDTTPSYVRVLDANYTSYVVATVDSNPTVPLYSRHIPFFIEVQDDRSTLGLLGEERMARVLRQLEGCSQKACELELWDGAIALQGSSTDLVNPYLSKGTTLIILPGRTSAGAVADPTSDGAAISVKHGISVLEHQIGQYSSAGEQGWIHMTRDTAAVLSSYNQMVVDYYDPNKGSRQHLQTFGGTPLVLGSGYSGNGPVVNVTNKALTTNFATLTTATNHGLAVGDTVVVTGVDATFNGTYVTTSGTTATTIKYAKTATDVVSIGTTGGTAQMQANSRYKWIYASGEVRVYLGDSDLVNDGLAQGYAVASNQNDMRIKATRPAAVYFDTSIHLGVKVDLTLTN
jgi:hypothetical protein